MLFECASAKGVVTRIQDGKRPRVRLAPPLIEFSRTNRPRQLLYLA